MLLKALLVAFGICCYLEACFGAKDSGVIVFGTTVGPNFKRAEGICKWLQKVTKQQVTKHYLAATSLRPFCPITHPLPCEKGVKCSSEESCNGTLLDIYSQCCPNNITLCHLNPAITCKKNLNGKLNGTIPTGNGICPNVFKIPQG